MSSPCNFMEHPEWTPEQRTSVALVETLRMKRSEEEQARAERNHARATAPHTLHLVLTPLPTADDSALLLPPLDADESSVGNPLPKPLSGWRLVGVAVAWLIAVAFTTWLAGWLS